MVNKTFDQWFDELCNGNQIWSEQISMHHKPKTFEDCARKVYMKYVADEVFPPMQVARGYVGNVIGKVQPDKTYSKDWAAKALEKIEEKKEEEWKPVSWSKRAEYLEQVQAEIDKIDDRKIRPLLDGEAEVNGQDDPPKPKAKCAPSAPVEVVVDHINKVRTARRKFFLERNPNASEEEIQEYINKFDVL